MTIEEEIEFANEKNERHATKENSHRSLRDTMFCDPCHDYATNRKNNCLNDFNGRILAGSEAVGFTEHDMQFEATRCRELHLRQ